MSLKNARRSSRAAAGSRLASHPNLSVERLEGRRLLTAVIVNTLADTDAVGTVTLRDAIATANASATPTTITFDPTVFAAAQTITLGGTQLALANTAEPTTITGPAAGVTVSGGGASRVMYVNSGVSVDLTGLTLSDGNTSAAHGGGGMYSFGTVTMTDCTVSDNTSSNYNAGIGNDGTMSLTDVMISGNQATGGTDTGGLVEDPQGTLTLNRVSILNNTATAGGGVVNNGGTMVLNNVTIAGNTATNGPAGGFANGGVAFTGQSGGTTTMNEVTVTGNTASDGGGGIANVAGSFTVSNSIIAGNVALAGAGDDAAGTITSLGYNLVGSTTGSQGWLGTDLTGTAAAPLAAHLGSLAANGGPTQTVLPLAGSPAIAAGSVALIPSGVTTDQRGDPRTIDGTVDIGAVEVGGAASPTPTPTPTSTPGLTSTVTKTTLPTALVTGAKLKGAFSFTLVNDTGATLKGTATVNLYAYLGSAAPTLIGSARHALNLKTGKSTPVTIPVRPVVLPAGTYGVYPTLTLGADTSTPTTGTTVAVAAANIALAGTVGAPSPSTVAPGKTFAFLLTVTNAGNVKSSGRATIAIYLSTDGTSLSLPVATVTKSVTIKPDGRVVLPQLRVKLSKTATAGAFFPIVVFTQGTATFTAAATTAVTVG